MKKVFRIAGMSVAIAAFAAAYAADIPLAAPATVTEPIALAGGDRLVISGTGTVDINGGMTLTTGEGGDTVRIVANTNATVNFNSAFSGDAHLQLMGDGGGKFNFNAANPEFDGNLLLSMAAEFNFYNSGAFGTTAGYTVFTNWYTDSNSKNTSLLTFHDIDTSEEFHVSSKNQNSPYFYGNNVFRGRFARHDGVYNPVSWNGGNGIQRWYALDGGKVEFKNIDFSAQYFILTSSGSNSAQAKFAFTGGRIFAAPFSLGGFSGTYEFAVTGTTSQVYWGIYNSPVMKMMVPDVFVDTSGNPVKWEVAPRSGSYSDNNSVRFVLEADQTSKALVNSSVKTDVSSTNGSTLTLTGGDADSVDKDALRGTFSGNVNLTLLAGHSANYTISQASTSAGTLTLGDGAEVQFTGSGGWDGNLVLGRDSTIRTGAMSVFTNGAATVTMDPSSHIELNCGMSASSLTVGGETLPYGTYGGTGSEAMYVRNDLFSGTALLSVALPGGDVTHTWDGGAGADTSVQTDQNWVGDDLPPLSSGLPLIFLFSSAGTSVSIDRPISTKSFTISYPEGSSSGFHFDDASGAGSMLVMGSGISAAAPGDGIARMNVFDVPISFSGTQTWNLDGEGCMFDFRKPLSGVGIMTKIGSGELALSGANTFSGSFAIEDGPFYWWNPDAFGSADVTIRRPAVVTITNATHTVITNAITIKSAQDLMDPIFIVGTNASVEIAGPITYSQNFRPAFKKNSRTIISGGIMTAAYTVFGISEDYQLIFTNTPLQLANFSVYASRGFVDFYTQVRQPLSTGYYYFLINGVCTNRFLLPYVFDNDKVTFAFGYHSDRGQLDISGGDQRFGALGYFRGATGYEPKWAPNTCSITSSGRSMLHGYQDAGTDFFDWRSPFTGGAGLVKEGPAMLVFSNCVSTTTGELHVAEGTLRFVKGSSWPNCAEVYVYGGTLDLTESASLNPKGDLRIDSGATVQLANGTVQTVRQLYVNGGHKAPGWYGSNACTDARVPLGNKLAVLSGTGVIMVKGNPGMMMLFR